MTSCQNATTSRDAEEIIGIERAALDRWGEGDPQGYLETYGPEITYFDPNVEKRVDGIEAMQAYYAPFAGKIKVDHYEMIGAKVQRVGDAGVLSYQLESHAISPDGTPFTVRWNSTKVYISSAGTWKLVHDHWSFIRPELKDPLPGPQ